LGEKELQSRIPKSDASLKQLRILFNEKKKAHYAPLIKKLNETSSADLLKIYDGTRANLDVGFANEIRAIITEKQGAGKGLSFKKKGKKVKGGMLSDEQGGGFFSDLKDLAKKGVSKLVEKVAEDPIGSAKKAFEMGQKGRDEYKKYFGKKEGKGGKLFIPKKHLKMIHRHLKKQHGGGFADMFIKGLTAPFQLAAKINPALGFGVPQVSSALGLPSLF